MLLFTLSCSFFSTFSRISSMNLVAGTSGGYLNLTNAPQSLLSGTNSVILAVVANGEDKSHTFCFNFSLS